MKSVLLPASLLICLTILSCSSGSKSETATQTDSAAVASAPQAPIDQPAVVVDENDTSFAGFVRLFDRAGTQVLQTDPVYVLMYVQFVPAGQGMDNLHAATYSKDGTFISDTQLGSAYESAGPGGSGEDYTYDYDAERKVIAVTNSSIEWDEEKEEEVTSETLNYFLIDEDGNITEGREYPQISQQYLAEGDLEQYSKEELKIMRNEIFAVYGYIFKTEPMKSYYAAMRWYKPTNDNVDDFLTDIERGNVKLIKEVEDSK